MIYPDEHSVTSLDDLTLSEANFSVSHQSSKIQSQSVSKKQIESTNILVSEENLHYCIVDIMDSKIEPQKAKEKLNFCFPLEIEMQKYYYFVPLQFSDYHNLSLLRNHMLQNFNFETLENVIFINSMTSDKGNLYNTEGNYEKKNLLALQEETLFEIAEPKNFEINICRAKASYEKLYSLTYANEEVYEVLQSISPVEKNILRIKKLYLMPEENIYTQGKFLFIQKIFKSF